MRTNIGPHATVRIHHLEYQGFLEMNPLSVEYDATRLLLVIGERIQRDEKPNQNFLQSVPILVNMK